MCRSVLHTVAVLCIGILFAGISIRRDDTVALQGVSQDAAKSMLTMHYSIRVKRMCDLCSGKWNARMEGEIKSADTSAPIHSIRASNHTTS